MQADLRRLRRWAAVALMLPLLASAFEPGQSRVWPPIRSLRPHRPRRALPRHRR